MPAALVKSFAAKSGKSVSAVEKLWQQAKDKVVAGYPDVKVDSDKYWKLVVGVLKRMVGMTEAKRGGHGDAGEDQEKAIYVALVKRYAKEFLHKKTTGIKLMYTMIASGVLKKRYEKLGKGLSVVLYQAFPTQDESGQWDWLTLIVTDDLVIEGDEANWSQVRSAIVQVEATKRERERTLRDKDFTSDIANFKREYLVKRPVAESMVEPASRSRVAKALQDLTDGDLITLAAGLSLVGVSRIRRYPRAALLKRMERELKQNLPRSVMVEDKGKELMGKAAVVIEKFVGTDDDWMEGRRSEGERRAARLQRKKRLKTSAGKKAAKLSAKAKPGYKVVDGKLVKMSSKERRTRKVASKKSARFRK